MPRGVLLRCFSSHAHLLSAQPLHRALPDLQQDAARRRVRAGAGKRQAAPAGRGCSSSSRGGSATARDRRRAPGGREVRVHRESAPQEDGYETRSCPACTHPRTPPASRRRSPSPPVACCACSRAARAVQRDPRARRRRRAGARDLDVLPHRLPLAAAGRGSVRGHPPGAGARGRRQRVREASRREGSPLDGVPLGPRTSHDPARGSETCARLPAVGARTPAPK